MEGDYSKEVQQQREQNLKFAEWKAAAQAHANDLGVVDGASLWDEDDSYDLALAAREAFAAGQDPKAFVEESFAEDLARAELDEQQRVESDAQGEEVPSKRKGGRYVEVPREAILSRLERAGFTRDDVPGEITYSRRHDRDDRLLVTVYTSVADGADAGRGRGEDAIRVLAFFTWTRKGETHVRRKKLYQARVFRVTSVKGVLERTMERARDAYAACNKWIADDIDREADAVGRYRGRR